MLEQVVSSVLMVVAVYLILGLIFTIVFFLYGIDKVDKDAKGSGWIFKLLILPGMMVFWPLFLNKWRKVK